MLPEYDFSGGVRGKYAARLAKHRATLMNTAPPTVVMPLTEREVAMIVAALRNWLDDFEGGEKEPGQDLEEAFGGHFRVHPMLTFEETEALIARFSFDESQGFIRTRSRM